LYDTSVFVGLERERIAAALPEGEACVSVVTVAELHLGVLQSRGPEDMARRLQTIGMVERGFEAIPADLGVMRRFATLTSEQRARGRRPRPLDTIIAATASYLELGIVTQDRDFERFDDLEVVLV
jgi:predicted nucleic acid-binding protein